MVRLPTRNQRLRLCLLGILLLLLTGCSGGPQTQGPTLSPTLTSTPGKGATTRTTTPDWATLENRPLHLPVLAPGAACPVTPAQQLITPDHRYAVGTGPVYLVNEAIANPIVFLDAGSMDAGSHWKISKIFWEVAATYSGPALIRGARIDGTHSLGFNGGLGQTAGNTQGTEPVLHELRLQGDPGGQWKTYLSFLRIQASGCYAVQIDGQGFSENLVFEAAIQ